MAIDLRQKDTVQHLLSGEEAATRFGAALGRTLAPGDVVLLSGPLGAGKSHIARAAIRAAMDAPDLAVPSPTYTLVNVYQPAQGPEIWHGDLYRLSATDELDELGLEDAADHAILLVEWPERWTTPPARHLHLDLTITGADTRTARLTPKGVGWTRVLAAMEAAQ